MTLRAEGGYIAARVKRKAGTGAAGTVGSPNALHLSGASRRAPQGYAAHLYQRSSKGSLAPWLPLHGVV